MAAGATSGRSANGWKPPGKFLFGDDVALTRFPEFVAEGCLQDDYLSDLLITQAFLGTLVEDDANVGLEVISVEFIADDRALVKGLLTIDGRPADEVFGGSDDDEPGLWVRENGEWRSADDCALYGTAGDE